MRTIITAKLRSQLGKKIKKKLKKYWDLIYSPEYVKVLVSKRIEEIMRGA